MKHANLSIQSMQIHWCFFTSIKRKHAKWSKQIMQIHLILLYFNQNQRCKLIKTWLYRSKSWFFTLFQLFVDSFLMFVICMIAWLVFCDCMNFVLFHFAWLHASCCLRFMIWCWWNYEYLRMYTGAVLGTTPHTPHTSPTKTLNNTRTHQKTAKHSITF